MFLLREHNGCVLLSLPGVDLDPVTRSGSRSRNFLSRIPFFPMEPLFILHSSQPAAARLYCGAAESIVRWEPGYTHRLHCSVHVSTASRTSPRLSVAAVGMMQLSFLSAFCSSNQTKRAFSVPQSPPLSSACARLPLIRLIRRSAQRWFQGSRAGPTLGHMLTNAMEPAGSAHGTCLHVWLWC